MSQGRISLGSHDFGGSWTEQKLAVLDRYLARYTTALKRQPFELWYIDAFAGTGARTESAGPTRLFRRDVERDAIELRKGSARLALETSPPFDRFHFIDKNRAHCGALERMCVELAPDPGRVSIECDDANEALRRLCRQDWLATRRRAVVFIDPYATQVRFSTLEAIASTRAMDVWVLFPLMAVNRMLTRSGDIPDSWRARLDDLLGTAAWPEALYRVKVERGLFQQPAIALSKARIEALGRYFLDRLRIPFVSVARDVKILANSRGAPLFLLCFAASNPKGAPIAVKIANHLLRSPDF